MLSLVANDVQKFQWMLNDAPFVLCSPFMFVVGSLMICWITHSFYPLLGTAVVFILVPVQVNTLCYLFLRLFFVFAIYVF